MPTPTPEGRYIYCITRAEPQRTFGPLGIGGRNDALYAVRFGDIAAVVSDSPIRPYPLSHENLVAHERAIEAVMEQRTVLPVRFCTIAADDDNVRRILERAHDRICGLLDAMAGKKELGLKVLFRETVYQDILEKYADIRALKERLAGLPAAQTQPQRMEIGRMVEAALQREKGLKKDEVLAALSPLATQFKVNRNYGELMLLSAAFLVAQEREADFDRRVDQLDADGGGKVKYKYVGTLPPFNFVNLVIDTRRMDLAAVS